MTQRTPRPLYVISESKAFTIARWESFVAAVEASGRTVDDVFEAAMLSILREARGVGNVEDNEGKGKGGSNVDVEYN